MNGLLIPTFLQEHIHNTIPYPYYIVKDPYSDIKSCLLMLVPKIEVVHWICDTNTDEIIGFTPKAVGDKIVFFGYEPSGFTQSEWNHQSSWLKDELLRKNPMYAQILWIDFGKHIKK